MQLKNCCKLGLHPAGNNWRAYSAAQNPSWPSSRDEGDRRTKNGGDWIGGKNEREQGGLRKMRGRSVTKFLPFPAENNIV